MPFLLIGFVFGDIVCLLLGAYTYVRMIAAERKDVQKRRPSGICNFCSDNAGISLRCVGRAMSREEELFELSAVYHGQREYVEGLRQQIAVLKQLVADFLTLTQQIDAPVMSDPDEWYERWEAAQERAKQLQKGEPC